MTGDDTDHREARVPSIGIDLGPTSDGSAFATWKNRLGVLYEIRLPEGAGAEDFTVRGRTWQLPSAIVTSVRRSGVELRRDAEFIAKNPVDHVCLYFAMRGAVIVNCGDREVALDPGDIFFQDYRRPTAAIACDPYANVTLMFTRTTGPALFRDGALHGAILPAKEPGARLLHAQLAALLAQLDELPVRIADAAVAALLSLAATMMDSGRGGATSPRAVDRAVEAVRSQIGDPLLTPAAIAAELGVSRAKLYRLLEPYGGVRNLISRVRLDESLKTLADTPPDSIVMADIALHHGFTSAAQFNRAFRARFGRTPREILALRKANPKAQLYRAWVEARRAQSDFETIDAWLEAVTR